MNGAREEHRAIAVKGAFGDEVGSRDTKVLGLTCVKSLSSTGREGVLLAKKVIPSRAEL
jgi:hypothetical protein